MKVKNKPKKATAVKRLARPQPGVMAIVPYSEIVKPIMYGGRFSLIKTYFGPQVLKFITRPTPPQYVSQREGPGKKMYSYVDGHYAKKCANYAFGFCHSMTILEQKIVGTSVITTGRLIITDPKTGKEVLHKDDNGSHVIRFLKDKAHTPDNAVDIGNDYKASATDCLKRCMVQMGFFSDVYGRAEAVETGIVVQNDELKKPAPATTGRKEQETIIVEAECSNDAEPITKAEAEYSKKIYGKPLCRTCQQLKREGKI